jgi:hypothetical protein
MKNTSICLILLLVAGMSLSGCVFYQRYPLAQNRLTKIDKYPLTYYVLDASRPQSRVWYVSEAEFSEDQMQGFLVRVSEEEARDVAMVTSKRDAKYSKNDVLLYANPRYALTLADTSTVTLRYDQLEKIEVYEANHEKSLTVSLLAALLPVMFLGALADY